MFAVDGLEQPQVRIGRIGVSPGHRFESEEGSRGFDVVDDCTCCLDYHVERLFCEVLGRGSVPLGSPRSCDVDTAVCPDSVGEGQLAAAFGERLSARLIVGTDWVAPGADLGDYDVGLFCGGGIGFYDVVGCICVDGTVCGAVAESPDGLGPGVGAVEFSENRASEPDGVGRFLSGR